MIQAIGGINNLKYIFNDTSYRGYKQPLEAFLLKSCNYQRHPRPERSIENEHMLSGDPDNTNTLFMMY
jgi:hypothetical protein